MSDHKPLSRGVYPPGLEAADARGVRLFARLRHLAHARVKLLRTMTPEERARPERDDLWREGGPASPRPTSRMGLLCWHGDLCRERFDRRHRDRLERSTTPTPHALAYRLLIAAERAMTATYDRAAALATAEVKAGGGAAAIRAERERLEKMLPPLLEAAAAAVGVVPMIPPLTDNMQCFLIALSMMNAGPQSPATRASVVAKAFPCDSDGEYGEYRKMVAHLVKMGLIVAKSGQSGGLWLSRTGRRIAAALDAG